MQRVAELSRPSTSRGPGRGTHTQASAITILSAPSAYSAVGVGRGLRGTRARRRSRTGRRSRPGSRGAATSSHERRSDGSPARPSRSTPPAYSISCGTQWPPTKTGSGQLEHRHPLARRVLDGDPGRGRCAPAASCTRSTPASLESVAWASVRTSPSTWPRSCCGSRLTIRGTGCISAAIARTSSTETAQTLHSAWVTIRSGLEVAQADAVELVDRAALLGQLAHRAVDGVRRKAGPDHIACDLG